MTAAELIAKLQQLPPETKLSLDISDPKDAAWTDDFDVNAQGVLHGWVASDNEEAFAPWRYREDD
jgi:hypothetical protein